MSESRQLTDEQLDAALRQVRVPHGVLARLAELADEVGSQDELREELKAPALVGDELDEPLREVPVPAHLLAALRDIPQELDLSDDELDEVLREVDVPAGLLSRLRRIAAVPERPIHYRQMAMAACLLIAVGVAYLGALGGLVLSLDERMAQATDALQVPEIGGGWVGTPDDMAAGDGVLYGSGDWRDSKLVLDLDLRQPYEPRSPGGLRDEPFWWQLAEPVEHPELFADANLERWGHLGFPADGRSDSPSVLRAVEPRRPQGVEPPPAGFDWDFFLKHGVHPSVQVADLPRSIVPLIDRTDSFQETLKRLGQGQRPDPETVRVEEFLAAFEYGFQPPQSAPVAVRTAAGPSPFQKPGRYLLQIAVQGHDLQRLTQPPGHLTVAIDISGSMNREQRWQQARRAVEDVAGQLQPGQRLSVVVFNQHPYVLAEQISAGQAQPLLEELERIVPFGETNIGAGLQAAYAVAGDGLMEGERCPVVLISDGELLLSQETQERIEAALAAAAADGLELTVVEAGRGNEADSPLPTLAQVGGGMLRQATGWEAIRWALLNSLTGNSQVVASDVELSVRFNPESVESYRLLGFEKPLGIGEALPAGSDFRSLETRTALFEVQLKPSGGEEIAWAELDWRDPASGQPGQARQRISRVQFVGTYREAPISLQLAALVAETAEQLRESPFTEGHSLEQVEAQSRQVSRFLRRQPSFQEFQAFLEQVQAAK